MDISTKKLELKLSFFLLDFPDVMVYLRYYDV